MAHTFRMRWAAAAVAAAASVLFASPALAQDETALKKAFEGRRVILKIEMPATSEGVDVWPGREIPVEFPKVAARIKANGVAIRAGDEQMITKVHVVRNHIEFQLGGGGYGTFSDILSSGYQAPITHGETAEERRIKREIANTTDASARRSLERRLGELERQRQADNAAAERQAVEMNRAQQAEEREKRLAAGSRFNIRFDGSVPAEALTPQAVMAALAEYVDFAPMGGAAAASASAAPPAAAAPTGPGAGAVALRKGMTVEEVEQLLGPAKAVQTDDASGLEIMIRTYHHPDHKVVAKFAAGVLVDFAITPH